tara:strand:+ start:897 stop:1127 length:231 start_codon:yes stop_codon:yes gene_type:complete
MEEYFFCRKCDDEYTSRSKLDSKSNLLGKYVKYLGYCSEKCFNKLDGGEKNEDLMFSYIYGDLRKREYSQGSRFKI